MIIFGPRSQMICILLQRSVFSQICFFLRSLFSQICRMLFELQQARGEDGGRVESLEVLFLSHLIFFLILYLFLLSSLCFVFLCPFCPCQVSWKQLPRAFGFITSTNSRKPRWLSQIPDNIPSTTTSTAKISRLLLQEHREIFNWGTNSDLSGLIRWFIYICQNTYFELIWRLSPVLAGPDQMGGVPLENRRKKKIPAVLNQTESPHLQLLGCATISLDSNQVNTNDLKAFLLCMYIYLLLVVRFRKLNWITSNRMAKIYHK